MILSLLLACVGAAGPPEGVDPATGVDCATAAAPDDPCPAAAIGCDETVEHTTEGATSRFDRATWADAFCLGALASQDVDLSGPDRVYAFDVPPDATATVTLTSPCARLDLRVVNTATACTTRPDGCSTASTDPPRAVVTALVGGVSGRRYEIVVDGMDGEAGAYRLQTACSFGPPR